MITRSSWGWGWLVETGYIGSVELGEVSGRVVGLGGLGGAGFVGLVFLLPIL